MTPINSLYVQHNFPNMKFSINAIPHFTLISSKATDASQKKTMEEEKPQPERLSTEIPGGKCCDFDRVIPDSLLVCLV